LIIADSCFSGAISTNNVQGGALKVIITSGGVEPISDISGSGHSLFTGALLNSLRKGNTVTSKQLFGELTDKIGNRQRPEHKALTADDFVFVAK
jgi:hypothetical protein